MSVELPKDAEGREIPLETAAVYGADGKVVTISRWVYFTVAGFLEKARRGWYAIDTGGELVNPMRTHLTPSDTWEKLEEDLRRGADALNYEACAYFGKSACDCSSCIADKGETCERVVMRDIASRIRKLRGEA